MPIEWKNLFIFLQKNACVFVKESAKPRAQNKSPVRLHLYIFAIKII